MHYRTRTARAADPTGSEFPRDFPRVGSTTCEPMATRKRKTAPKTEPEPQERAERRALSHVGGKVEFRGGSEQEKSALEQALDVTPDEKAVMAHVHGFHSYPARLHPLTASRLIEKLTRAHARVLDPFCGSGTVLVEARLLGRQAFGVDANPLAVELAWLKTRSLPPRRRAELLAAARQVAEHAETRRKAKAGPTRRYDAEDRELFEVHVLLELDGLKAGIDTLAGSEDLKRALRLVLSAILTKVSRRPGDTTARRVTGRRLASGYTIKLFTRKAEELEQRLAGFTEHVPRRTPEARVAVGDARDLGNVRPASIDLVLSSPPYPGVYDYIEHHASRLAWLDLDARAFSKKEIGSRRNLSRLPHIEALRRWERELGACLAEMARVVHPDGKIALVIADSVLGGTAVYADELLERLAPRAQLSLGAVASQVRPYFHAPTASAFRKKPRREHVVLLERGA